MESNVRKYIELLTHEVKSVIQRDYDLSEYDFRSFDFINFYLINTFILNTKEQDLFIGIPEDEYRENFFESILYSVSLIKYFQNYTHQEEDTYSYEKDDLILNNNKIYKFIRFKGNKICVSKKFPNKHEKGAQWEIKRQKYPVLLKEFDYKESVFEDMLSGYRKFYKSKLRNQDIEFLTSFNRKVLVVSSKQITNINKYIPFRYWSKSGNQKHSLPIEVMIEICNDFKTAKKLLLDKNEKFDELIIIGDTKYNKDEDFSEVIKAKNLGQIKNIILIGSVKPETEHHFLTWDWSVDEVKIANNESIVTFRNEEMDYPEMTDLTNELVELIEKYKQDKKLDLSSCLKFCNYFFKLPLPTNDKSSAIIDDYLQRVRCYFESDEMERTFHDADIYEPDRIESIQNDILTIFERFGLLLKSKNPKFEHLITKVKENSQNFIIIDKYFAPSLEIFLAQHGIDKTKIISDRKSDSSKHNLDTWLKDEKLNTEIRNYYIPYAINKEQFNSLINLKGNITFLSYKNLDSLRFSGITRSFTKESEKKLAHIDRCDFVKTKYQSTEPQTSYAADGESQVSNAFDSVFFNDGKEGSEFVEEEKQLDEYKDDIEYKITFTDNTELIAKSSKAVFLIEGAELAKITIGDVHVGAKIRYYRNETHDDFERTLQHFDKDGLLQIISKHSHYWKNALLTLRSHLKSETTLLEKLRKKKLRIARQTFSNYFRPDNDTDFPRVETLKKIKELCIEYHLNNIEFVTHFNEILKYRAKDKEVRQSVGRLLSNELLDWVATKEKSENLKAIPEDILNNIKYSVQEKTVKSKKNIERNEIKLQTELPFNI